MLVRTLVHHSAKSWYHGQIGGLEDVGVMGNSKTGGL